MNLVQAKLFHEISSKPLPLKLTVTDPLWQTSDLKYELTHGISAPFTVFLSVSTVYRYISSIWIPWPHWLRNADSTDNNTIGLRI